jgi:hypothetical protein
MLFLFLFNSMGYYFLFELNKHLAWREMQVTLKRHPGKLTVLRIADVASNHEFQRIDKKEFRYKGNMFDVVSEVKTGHVTVFVCRMDTRETDLFAELNRETQNRTHGAKWAHTVIILISVPSFDLNPAITGKLSFPRIDIPLKSSSLPTWSPPPEGSFPS